MLILSLVLILVFVLALQAISKFKVKNVHGKVALVTGGGNGLGKAICIKLADVGCNIAIADIDFESAQKTTVDLIAMGVSAKAYKVDVSSYAEIEKLKANVIADLGEVDILVNNAGLIPYKSLFDQSADEIERLTRVNFNSVILMTKCFLENMMRRNTGHIATVTSLQGVYPFAHSLTYSATKFGATGFMMGLVEFLRMQGFGSDIHATIIMPDVISTREDLKSIINSNYKMLTAEQVAQASVDGILRNQKEVSVPSLTASFARIFCVLPYKVQNILRDIRQESTFLVGKSL